MARECLLLGYTGLEPPGWLLDGLGEGLGGVVLFANNLTGRDRDVRALTDRLRAAAGRDVVVALDEEGGDVTRLDQSRGSRYPGAAALGALDDVEATEEVYAAIGARLADAGVTLNLAPVADVNSQPRNPVIGVRSFGADPALVGRQVAAAVRGLQRSGIAACAKHFPGHGNSVDDSHHEVATLAQSRAELDATDLPPFRAAIEAGVAAIMTGHLLVPALDPDRLVTVSPAATRLLREELGFAGAIVTDALEMRALSGTVGMTEGFVQALIAGADALETGAQAYPQLMDEIPKAVVAAVHDGRLREQRLADAAARTATLARPGRAAAFRPTDAARRSLQTAGDLDLALSGDVLILECRTPNGMATGAMPWSFAAELAARLPRAHVVVADGPADVPAAIAALAQASRPTVLVVRDPDRFPWQRQVLAAVERHRQVVLVDLGWPAELPAGRGVLRTHGVAPDLLAAAAQMLADANTTVRQRG